MRQKKEFNRRDSRLFSKKYGAVLFKYLTLFLMLSAAPFAAGQRASAFEYDSWNGDDNYDDDGYDDEEDDGDNDDGYDDGNDEPGEPDNPSESDPITDLQFSLNKNTFDYTGKAITPTVTVRGVDSLGQSVILKKDVDYTLQYEDNINYGVGRVIVLGKGDFSGYHILKFGIMPGKVSGVKVKSPHYMENTVTWNKAKGADGYYIYRKAVGDRDYSFVANITDADYQVFHDKSKALKKNRKYSYKITSYVRDNYYDEETDGDEYERPSEDEYDYYLSSSIYTNSESYYSSLNNSYYLWFNYSAIKGRCRLAFETSRYGSASGKVTAKSSGRYSIYTGNANIDYMAYVTNNKIIKKGMSNDKRVKAIFDWMVKNCTFTKTVKSTSKLKKMKCYINYNSASVTKKAQAYEKKIMNQIYKGKALCIGESWHDCDRAEVALAYRKGSCSYLSPMFNILCNQAGVEAYIVDGYYVNRDKSRDYHNWSFVKLGNKYYWYDVPVACKNKKVKATWYKKGTKFWKTCHKWSSSATRGYRGATFKK